MLLLNLPPLNFLGRLPHYPDTIPERSVSMDAVICGYNQTAPFYPDNFVFQLLHRFFLLVATAWAFTYEHLDAMGNNTMARIQNHEGLKLWLFWVHPAEQEATHPEYHLTTRYGINGPVDPSEMIVEGVVLGHRDTL